MFMDRIMPNRRGVPAPLLAVLPFLLVLLSPPPAVRAGETSLKSSPIPQTLEKMKERMGNGYDCIDKEGLLIVSDLDKKTLYRLMAQDFFIYMHILKRDFFTKPQKAGNQNRRPLLTVFLFKNRESYVAGLRKIGMSIAAEDENNQSAVRNGYFYGGKERNFILINYRDNYEYGISTYAHELVHALLGEEFPRAPAWINEGIATMVGNSRVVNSHLRYAGSPSLGRMKKALEEGTMIPLSEILQLTGKDYAGRSNSLRYYDAGAQFCRFLHSRNQLLPIYRDLRDNTKNRETDVEIICRITGLRLDNLEKAWHDWLRRQE